jgi:site-specific DNA-cytosine methylase
MDTIELFCGGGGGAMAHSHLLGHTPVAAAEWGDYQQLVLKARMRDGSLPKMHLWGDVRQASGTKYHGIGCVSGGFPCTDISAAGSGIGIDGEASKMVWEMLRVVDEAKPRYVFAENSPRLRLKGLNRIVAALTNLGFGKIAWGIVSARDVGAPHIRERMWLLAKRSPGAAVVELPVDMPRDGTFINGKLSRLKPWITARKAPTMPTLISADAAAAGNRPDPSLWSLSDILGITAKATKMGIKTLPTLAATDWKSPYGTQGLLKQLEKRSKPLRDVLPLIEGGYKINPLRAEWYMGWCPGWTDLDVKPRVSAWAKFVKRGRWWTDGVEHSVLPRTLPSGAGVPHLNQRIHALGNGQVPLACATAFTLLKEALA